MPDAAANRSLRQRAEEKAAAIWGDGPGAYSREEAGRLLHELRVHQIELEMNVEELRRAQEALEASRERYFELYDLAPVGYLTLDAAGLIREANLRAGALLGVPQQQLLGKRLSAYVVSEDQDLYYQRRRQLATDREVQAFELRMRGRDGIFWARFEASAAEGGDELASRVVISDVTIRKRAEEVIRSERWLQHLLRALPVGVCSCDERGQITLFNERAAELWGHTATIGASAANFADAFPLRRPDGTRLDADEGPLARALRDGQAARDEDVLIERPDGSRLDAIMSVEPFEGLDGKVLGAIGVFVDNSERARLRQQLERSVAELAAADRRKDDFIAVLSHELRNPLMPIRSAAEMLGLVSRDDPAVMECQQVIDRQVDQLGRLLDDLLDIGRIARDKLELRKARVELRPILELATATSQPLIAAGGLHLATELAREPLWIEADPARIAQVVANLLNNAAKFSQPGKRINLSSELARTAAGERAVIRVSDEGIGIPADMLPKIFDPFVQGAQPTSGKREGLGVGLALARRLVEMHGGSIRARSAGYGAGAEVVVELPLAETAPARVGPPPERATPVQRRFLVVDDQRIVADTVARSLQLKGNEVHVAYGGQDGVQQAVTLRPDIVLMDLSMPGMDGYRAAAEIRSRLAGDSPILVAMSGLARDEDKQRSREAGFDAHLTKPFQSAELREVIVAAERQRAS